MGAPSQHWVRRAEGHLLSPVVAEHIAAGPGGDLGGSAHILIRLTPIMEELELGRYGLEYIELDPLLAAPSPKGPLLYVWRDPDRTAAALNDAVPGAGARYRAFLDDWSQFAQALKNMFLAEPTPQ